MLSSKFIQAVKLCSERRYRLAQKAQIDASLLSKWINRIVPARNGDPRIVRLAKVLGLKPEDAFETNRTN